MADDRKDTEIKILPVLAPTLGIIRNIPSTMLDPRACVNCNNVRFKDGVVSTRTGYVTYGTGTITGVPIKLFRYQKWDGTEKIILATASHVYRGTGGAWTSIASGLSASVYDRVGLANIENHLVYTNGSDAPSKWDGTTWSALDDGKTIGWADYRPKIFIPYNFRLIGINDDKYSTGAGIRVIYSVLGDFDNVNDTGSGYIDFVQGEGAQFVGAAPLKNYIAMYKDYSCGLLDYVGGSSIFAFDVHIEGIGLAAPDAIANLGTSHLFLGTDLNFHEWNGGWELNDIGDPIKDILQSELATSVNTIRISFAVVNRKENEAHFIVPLATDSGYPTRMWTYNWKEGTWAKNTIAPMSGGGDVAKADVERMLLGTHTGTINHYNYSALTDNGSAISANFETGDFVIDKEEHLISHRRFYGVGLDLKGYSTSSKLKLEFSLDEGASWDTTDASTKTLTAAYALYNWDFMKTTRKIRFKFSDATSGQKWYLRFFGIKQKEGERE